MSGIFDETNMMRALKPYLPEGESTKAGIHACANESHIRRIFSGGILVGNTLIPSEKGGMVRVSRSKVSTCDIYLGITDHYLVMAECEECKHFYEYDADIDPRVVPVTEVHSEISLDEMGTCYRLDEIRHCEIKKGWMGSVKCSLTMKNGDFFRLMLPKLGGLGKGMPHHTQYRDEIIACLSAVNT
ncbi:MAG: hypothetical protein HFE83_08545 [Lachnospiraceae bacterium]|jgi:hypothetical protein|nr:hypothetical protein [Lachnospiraceae bacterium]